MHLFASWPMDPIQIVQLNQDGLEWLKRTILGIDLTGPCLQERVLLAAGRHRRPAVPKIAMIGSRRRTRAAESNRHPIPIGALPSTRSSRVSQRRRTLKQMDRNSGFRLGRPSPAMA